MMADDWQSIPQNGPAGAPLRILVLEDVALDAELIQAKLRDLNISFVARVVATRPAFQEALKERVPDLILSDFRLPSFDGLSALVIAREMHRDVPFIFVSGAIGEENVVALLHRGATDLVLKKNLAGLAPAVARALREREQRIEARRAVEALRETISVLHDTKRSFKSKTLGELRQKLERVVETTPWW